MFQKEIEDSLVQAGFEHIHKGGYFLFPSGVEISNETVCRLTLNYSKKLSPIDIVYLAGFKDGRWAEAEEIKDFFKKYR